MKKNIHPTYHTNISITCACGASFTAGSTEDSLSIEVCSQCHPFITGKQRLLDSSRRVEKFQEKLEKKVENKVTKQEKKARRAKKKAEKAATVEETAQ